MTINKSLTLAAAPQSLLELLGIQEALRGRMSLILQSPSANASPIFYGSKAAQIMELAPGAQLTDLAVVTASDIYFRGAGLVLNVLVIQH